MCYPLENQRDRAFKSLICGKLLGDGFLIKKRNARLQFRHSIKDKEYVEDQLALFSRFLSFGLNNSTEYTYEDPRTKKRYTTLICQSKTDIRLTELMALWYDSQGRKVLPYRFLEDYFNEESLAIWYQDDGCLRGANRILLSTECFSYDEVVFLQQLIEDKFGISSTIDSQRRIDIHNRKNVQLFLSYVSPFLSKGMIRKSLEPYYEKLSANTNKVLSQQQNLNPEWRRTTIYVPLRIKQKLQSFPSPAKELHRRLLVIEELEKIQDPLYRRKRILESIRHSTCTRAYTQISPYTVHIENQNYQGLKLLKQWTGIEMSDYILMLMKE